MKTAQSQKVKVSDFGLLHLSKKLNKLSNFECPVLLKHNNVLVNPVYIIFKNKIKCILCDGKITEMLLTTQLIEKSKNNESNLCIQYNPKLDKSILILTNF